MTELQDLIKKYNVLACPKSGIPKLTPTGRISKTGLKLRKDREDSIHKIANALKIISDARRVK